MDGWGPKRAKFWLRNIWMVSCEVLASFFLKMINNARLFKMLSDFYQTTSSWFQIQIEWNLSNNWDRIFVDSTFTKKVNCSENDQSWKAYSRWYKNWNQWNWRHLGPKVLDAFIKGFLRSCLYIQRRKFNS